MKKELRFLGIWMLVLMASVMLFGVAAAFASDSGPALFSGASGLPLLLGAIVPAVGASRPRQGAKIINWEGFKAIKDKDSKTIKEYIIGAYNSYLHKMANQGLTMEQIKISGADPTLSIIPIMQVISDPGAVSEPDRGYEAIFKLIDMRQSKSKIFNVLNMAGGVTFFQQLPGEAAKLTKVPKGSQTPVSMLRFIGGIPILDDWLSYNDFYLIDQLMEDTILGWWDTKATLFYSLLVNLDSSINQAYDTDIGTTINNACAQIMQDMKTVKQTGPKKFVITCRENDRFKIAKAISASFTNPNANFNEIVYNIQAVVPTTYLPAATANFYISLPGISNNRGEWEDFNARPAQRDELKLGADYVWTGAYNGIIGNKKQHRRCAMS